MNHKEMKSALESRLATLTEEFEHNDSLNQPFSRSRWKAATAVVASGTACILAAAVTTTPIHALPIALSSLAGASSGAMLAASTLTKAGLVICGTGISIPLGLLTGLASVFSAGTTGTAAWLWEMSHRSVSLWALGFHWIGIGLLVTGAIWFGYLLIRSYQQSKARPSAVCPT